MKIEDIKKLYTKTKKAHEKRTGEKYTWVMNAAQQRKGTATVCTNVTVDYEASLEHAMAYLARFEHDWAKRVEDLMKDAKKEAWKNEHTPGWHYGENDYFWAERTTPEYLAQAKAQELKNREEFVENAKAYLEKYGDFATCNKRAKEQATTMLNSPEVQSFLQQIGGTAEVETKPRDGGHVLEYYIRFHYTATAE